MLRPTAFLFVFLLFASLVPSLVAQAAPAERFTMQRITFKGTHFYNDEQLLKALGMKNGGSYTQLELQDSANKLSQTGMFAQVSYRFGPSFAEYNLIDNPKMLVVRFENFVWMPEAQLVAALKQRAPFFTGELPAEGTLAYDLGKQIEAILAEQGVKAAVQNLPVERSDRPAEMAYTVIEPRILMAAIHLAGLTPELSAKFNAPIKKNTGGEYSLTLLKGMEEVYFKPILDENGYLRATIGEPSFKLVSTSADPTANIELSLPIDAGAQYRIGSFSMKGTDSVSTEAGKKLAVFKAGDVANLRVIRTEMAALGSAYVAKGFLGAKVRAYPTFDDEAHTVSFNIEMVAGPLYQLSKLDMIGLDDLQKKKLAAIWKLNVGDVYDPAYASKFLDNNYSRLAFLHGASFSWAEKINDEATSVELTIFVRNAPATVK